MPSFLMVYIKVLSSDYKYISVRDWEEREEVQQKYYIYVIYTLAGIIENIVILTLLSILI